MKKESVNNNDSQPELVVNIAVDEPKAETQAEQQQEKEAEAKPEKDASAKKEETTPETPSLQQLIRQTVKEEDAPMSKTMTLRQILWGDFLTAEIVRRQIWLILLISLFVMIYIAQRYSYQKYIVEIDKKTEILKDVKFKALSSRSELTERTRQSKILDMLKLNNDSLLKISDRPPYYIKVPE